ncbi:MAG: hypothetical protein AB9846_15900 [Tenuifilaceae bacterium]
MFVQKRYKLFVLVYLLNSSFGAFSQNVYDYQSIFGEKYNDALTYIQKNRWISDSIARFGIDTNLAISIVFPELIRFSALRDKIETYSLEVLYVQYGSKYADFSIGRFQMKPSFAERLEKDWNNYLNISIFKEKHLPPFDTTNIQKNRILRLERLKNRYWQVKYLVMFIKLNEGKISDQEEELNFLASAYNVGYWNDLNVIHNKGKSKYYHLGLIKPSICYNYADISLFYYQKQMPK